MLCILDQIHMVLEGAEVGPLLSPLGESGPHTAIRIKASRVPYFVEDLGLTHRALPKMKVYPEYLEG